MSVPSTETHDALADRVIKLAAEQVELPPEQVELDSHFLNDLGYDSLDRVEFAMRIEDEFKLTIPDDVADGITTVRQAIEQTRRLLESQNRAE